MQISTILLPDNSLDWRFLLPIAPEIKLLVVGHECEGIYKYFLRLGIASVYYCTDAVPPPATDSSAEQDKQNIITFADLELRSDLLSFFDVVVFPQGLVRMEGRANGKVGRLSERHSINKYMRSGGVLLIGFANIFFSKKNKPQPGLYHSSPGKMKRFLKKNGYALTGIYGAIPDLFIPEYIFPLTNQSVGFILRSRYTYKIPGLFLHWLTNSFLTNIIANFFPAYFVVAKNGF
jgi:hypothetical protein